MGGGLKTMWFALGIVYLEETAADCAGLVRSIFVVRRAVAAERTKAFDNPSLDFLHFPACIKGVEERQWPATNLGEGASGSIVIKEEGE